VWKCPMGEVARDDHHQGEVVVVETGMVEEMEGPDLQSEVGVVHTAEVLAHDHDHFLHLHDDETGLSGLGPAATKTKSYNFNYNYHVRCTPIFTVCLFVL